MSNAGYQLLAGRIPGERVGDGPRTSTPATFTTTETAVDTVTAPLVAGRKYGIWWFAQCQSSVAGDSARARIREDNSTGTQITLRGYELVDAGVAVGIVEYGEYTAAATANKTFVGCLVRGAGTGNLTAAASATQLACIYVEYISG